jgi:putative endonuclease
MPHHLATGTLGETVAANFLTAKGFHILARNWRAGRCEVDIVAEDGAELVFVEVKTRHQEYLLAPEASVGLPKQRALVRAAGAWLEESGRDQALRFDVVAVTLGEREPHILHIPDAFHPLPHARTA